MLLTDFARCDIDAMNGAQLSQFARVVGEQSLEELDHTPGGVMRYDELVDTLARKTSLDPSEIAFGIIVASSGLDMLEVRTTPEGRKVCATTSAHRVD